jgi:hypothetical protein
MRRRVKCERKCADKWWEKVRVKGVRMCEYEMRWMIVKGTTADELFCKKSVEVQEGWELCKKGARSMM